MSSGLEGEEAVIPPRVIRVVLIVLWIGLLAWSAESWAETVYVQAKTAQLRVGKTSLACATAVALADAHKRVLLVSTDPASNLDEVLGVELNGEPKAVPTVDGLFALNIDPEASAKAYRERVVGPQPAE